MSSARPARPIHLQIAARTDPGREREGNEDSYLITAPGPAGRALDGGRAEIASPAWVAFAVCDGIGGAAGGEVASRAAVEVIREVMLADGPAESRDALGRRLVASVEEASRRILATSRESPELRGMGTTATVCALRGDVLLVAHVGDSRAYLLRGERLTQITRDQTLANLLLERGQLTLEDLPTFELGHVILQALGTAERIEVDLVELRIARGDVLLVCSDGLSGPVPDDAIRDVLTSAPSPEIAAEALVARANEAGGPDNVTCIVVRIEGEWLGPPAITAVPSKACIEPAPLSLEEAAPLPVEGESRGLLARLAALLGWG